MKDDKRRDRVRIARAKDRISASLISRTAGCWPPRNPENHGGKTAVRVGVLTSHALFLAGGGEKSFLLVLGCIRRRSKLRGADFATMTNGAFVLAAIIFPHRCRHVHAQAIAAVGLRAHQHFCRWRPT